MSMCISTAQARTRWALRGCPGLGLLHFHCKFSHKRPLLRCPCGFQLRRLAQSVGRGLPWAHFSWQAQSFVDLDRKVVETRNPLVILAGRIALAVAQREFWYHSDRSRCGAASVLISQPSRHFVRVRSLSLWRGARFDIACACLRNPLVTLGMSARSGCGVVLILADLSEILVKRSYEFCTRPSLTILQEFHGAVLEIRLIYTYIYIYPYIYINKYDALDQGLAEVLVRRWCGAPDEVLSEVLAWTWTGPYEKILWRSWWSPV